MLVREGAVSDLEQLCIVENERVRRELPRRRLLDPTVDVSLLFYCRRATEYDVQRLQRLRQHDSVGSARDLDRLDRREDASFTVS